MRLALSAGLSVLLLLEALADSVVAARLGYDGDGDLGASSGGDCAAGAICKAAHPSAASAGPFGSRRQPAGAGERPAGRQATDLDDGGARAAGNGGATANQLRSPSPARSQRRGRTSCSNTASTSPRRPPTRRFAWQKKTLADMEQELDKRIALLEAKTAETAEMADAPRRVLEEGARELVLIYARMRPDAAAAQLSAMDEETAAAVLDQARSAHMPA